MKKIIAFLFLSILFQNFTFCQKTEELESTTDSLKLEKPTEEKIFKVVENVYRFPGCEGQGLSKEELKKCIPLCSNCHRDLHHQEKLKDVV